MSSTNKQVHSLSISAREFPWASERVKDFIQHLKRAESSKRMYYICMDVNILGLSSIYNRTMSKQQ